MRGRIWGLSEWAWRVSRGTPPPPERRFVDDGPSYIGRRLITKQERTELNRTHRLGQKEIR